MDELSLYDVTEDETVIARSAEEAREWYLKVTGVDPIDAGVYDVPERIDPAILGDCSYEREDGSMTTFAVAFAEWDGPIPGLFSTSA